MVAAADLVAGEFDGHVSLGGEVPDGPGVGVIALPDDLAMARHRRPDTTFVPGDLVGGGGVRRALALLMIVFPRLLMFSKPVLLLLELN